MKIVIETIPYKSMRYATCGDYYWRRSFWGKEELYIAVAELGNWRYESLVIVHELVEALLCRHDGIPIEEIDDFDMQYEKDRDPSDIDSEPGDAVGSPYHYQHCIATGIERMLAGCLLVSWSGYEQALNKLSEN